MVRRREGRHVGTPGRAVPDHDSLSQPDNHAEHHAEDADRANAPDGCRPPIRIPASHGPVSSANATADSRTSNGNPPSTGGLATTVTRT